MNFFKIQSQFRKASREDGNATIEFALIFPVIISLFLMAFELGLLLTRGVMLDRAVDMSMRDLRLGNLTPTNHAELKNRICDRALIIPDCQNVVLIELRPIADDTWEPLGTDVTCVDREEEIDPVVEFEIGSKHEMMLVRVCALFDPFFPTTGLAAQMKLDNSGAYALVAASAYVNEP